MARPAHINFPPHWRTPASAEFINEIREQLDRVLSSPIFSKSRQAGQLLSFLVNTTLLSEDDIPPDNFKEYSVAVRGLGRAVDFDPNADNIVRVEIRRVRSKLERYYEEEGASDPVLISIPKGTYVPMFQRRDDSEFDLSGRTVSHYELLGRRCINRWQTTYDAKCLHLQRSVTVIVPTRRTLEDETRRLSLLESIRTGFVDHPLVASTLDVDEEDSRIIIATAQLPGRSLRQYVEAETITCAEANIFAEALAIAIAKGHSAGVFHGNLHPDSVTIPDGQEPEATPRPHIMAFGLSPLVEMTQPMFEGFRPPEWNATEKLDFRSDVWSFGAIVWFACTGSAPPLENPIPEREHGAMFPELAQVIRRCLHPDPAKRYVTAVEITEALAQLPSSPVNKTVVDPTRELRPQRILVPTVVLFAALMIVVLASLRFHRTALSVAVADRRVVIAPIANVSGDPDIDAYCRAAAEMLASRMALIRGVFVVPSAGLDGLRGDQGSPKSLLEKFRADYAVYGTLTGTGAGISLTVRLTELAKERDVWTGRYNSAWSEVPERIGEAAREAAGAMGLVAVPQRTSAPTYHQPTDPVAYEAWVKGRVSSAKFQETYLPRHFADAERRLTQALAMDPKYVDAIVEFGELYRGGALLPTGNQAKLLNTAAKFADEALAIDAKSAAAHALRGAVYLDYGRPRLALPHLFRAVELDSHDPAPYSYRHKAYEAMGFWESGLVELERSIDRDPVTAAPYVSQVMLLARLGRFTEALAAAESLDSGHPVSGIALGFLHLRRGDAEKAKQVLMQRKPQEPASLAQTFDAWLVLAQPHANKKDSARSLLQKFPGEERRYLEHYALLCAIAGEKGKLVAAIANSNIASYRWLVGEPALRPYREYPPYRNLVHHLYQQWQRDLAEVGQSLAVTPPALPTADYYLSAP